MNPTRPLSSQSIAPASPCVGTCELNHDDICIGCFRSRQEIGCWSSATAIQKQAVIEQADLRREARECFVKPKN